MRFPVFGTRLVERALAAELQGTVRIAYPSTGVVCTIDALIAPGPANPEEWPALAAAG